MKIIICTTAYTSLKSNKYQTATEGKEGCNSTPQPLDTVETEEKIFPFFFYFPFSPVQI